MSIGLQIVIAIMTTPLWVWLVFIYLIYIGIKSTSKNVIYLPRLFIIPVVLIALKYKYLSQTDNLVIYIIFILFGVFLGIIVALNVVIKKFFKKQKSIELPGNYYTLIILLLLFIIKYIFGYLKSTSPAIALEYLYLEVSVSALVSGFFLGRSCCYVYKYYKVIK